MVRKLGIPPENLDPLRYSGPRRNLTPVVEATRRPEIYDRNYPLFTFWRVNSPVSGTGEEGEIWYLARFADNGDVTYSAGDAVWLMLGTGSGGAMTNLRTDDGNLVFPIAGIIDVDGIVVANATNAKPLFTDGATANTARLELQVSTAITGAPADTNDAGIASFNDTHFSVDANGYVSLLGGGQAIDQVQVDFNTAPGVNPVSPDANGLIQIFGNTVTNGTNANAPVATHSRALNQFHLDVQLTTQLAASPADPYDAGLASFSDMDFTVDSNGYVRANSGLQPGISNIGFSYNAGTNTFTVHGADGTALSSTNPGFVTLQSKTTPGYLVTIRVTANQTFTDGSTGTTDNARFGVTTGVNWATDIPFFLYAVSNDSENAINFMISRSPANRRSPTSTSISKTGAIINVNQHDFFSLGNVTVTDYDLNPALCIGAFRMQFTGATDSWTVQTLSNNDGIGQFHEQSSFTMPTGQNGAAAGTFVLSSAGTEPVWTTQNIYYKLQKTGMADVFCDFQNVSTPGVGVNVLQIVIPFAPIGSQVINPGVYTDDSAGTKTNLTVGVAPNAQNTSSLPISGIILSGGTSNLLYDDIDTNDALQFNLRYRGFGD